MTQSTIDSAKPILGLYSHYIESRRGNNPVWCPAIRKIGWIIRDAFAMLAYALSCPIRWCFNCDRLDLFALKEYRRTIKVTQKDEIKQTGFAAFSFVGLSIMLAQSPQNTPNQPTAERPAPESEPLPTGTIPSFEPKDTSRHPTAERPATPESESPPIETAPSLEPGDTSLVLPDIQQIESEPQLALPNPEPFEPKAPPLLTNTQQNQSQAQPPPMNGEQPAGAVDQPAPIKKATQLKEELSTSEDSTLHNFENPLISTQNPQTLDNGTLEKPQENTLPITLVPNATLLLAEEGHSKVQSQDLARKVAILKNRYESNARKNAPGPLYQLFEDISNISKSTPKHDVSSRHLAANQCFSHYLAANQNIRLPTLILIPELIDGVRKKDPGTTAREIAEHNKRLPKQ